MFERKARYKQSRWTEGSNNYKVFADKNNDKGLVKHIQGELRNHRANHLKMVNFVKSMSGATVNIEKIMNKAKIDEIEKNKKFLLTVMDTISFLGGQGLALRGHKENCSSENRGNF